MARGILASASRMQARIGDRPSFEQGTGQRSGLELPASLFACFATVAGIAFLATMSGVYCLTSSIFMLEVHDWVMPSGSMATYAGVVILDLVLLGIQQRHHVQLRFRSNCQATERSDERVRLPKSCYGSIPEKIRGQTFADSLMWRCAVPQRAGPRGDARGLDTKA